MPIATLFAPAPAPRKPDEALATYLDTEFGKLKKALSGNLGNRWDDLTFSATTTRQGSLSKPDFDYTNNGLLFPKNDTSEILYGMGQFPHGWLGSLGVPTKLYPHIHYVQTGSSVPTFKMDYRLIYNGKAMPSYTTLTTTGNLAFTYVSGSLAQILEFPAIDVPGGEEGTSALFDMKLYRSDNLVTGDVLVKTADIHYEVYAIGSRLQYSDGLSGRA